jgi:hypothetical protein
MLCCNAKIRRAGVVGLALALSAAACRIDDVYVYRQPAPAEEDGADRAPSARPPIESAGDVFTFLQSSSSWRMEAADIPSHPNGYDENVNFGQASQCLHRVTMEIRERAFAIVTVSGTLEDAPRSGDEGRCDRASPNGTELRFDTTAALIENVAGGGDCFDITLTYSGFGQEGRGAIGADGATVALELYFRDQAIGHRCADGEVGADGVTLNQEPFGGFAVQTYHRGS